MSYKVTEQNFLNDVAEHRIKILLDNGVHRHIRFSNPGSSCQHFELITWPGYLAYVGDMGAYTFSRLNDMFEFFRTKPNGKNELYINLGYWSEKLKASDCNGRFSGGVTEYDSKKFETIVKQQYVRWCRECLHGDKEGRKELREAIDDLLNYADDGEEAVHIAARDFNVRRGKQVFEFSDFWEHNLRSVTTRFVWCCYALSWGIQQYDKAKSQQHPASEGDAEVDCG